ncbi:hypothetical protein [Lactobacillus taiwanensis]|uniref:Uncharacterized protein n=1 Tax=Lactobacillus taiwanensis TaxID=508451 RepID=A0A256LCV5_9LACO|nr:hypothetical protein [Lactobacillus taiwanensis]OYR87363.1 hypothetical protein CBF53_07895 [Lactobacillus taiwanensis]OYR90983.1 hypothetical protein CBF70_07335 [Lactobacillus taiwanensis]OYR91262.1 hypothetical protein CBF59_06825 [Lactobacillus taiwanensis]
MELNKQQKFLLEKLDAYLDTVPLVFLSSQKEFSYLVNHILAKLEGASSVNLTSLKDEVNEIVQEDMEC